VPKRIQFFALKSDILLVLSEMERKTSLHYVLTGHFPSMSLPKWMWGGELPDIGFADGDQHIQCSAYLVARSGTVIHARPIEVLGVQQFSVDQLLNPDTVVFTPAGERKHNIIIAGSFTTLSDSRPAQSIMRLAVRTIKRHFTRINAFWVGPEALARFRTGTRLTYAEQSPPEYDLREIPQ